MDPRLHHFLHYATNLGDSGFLAVLALIVAAYLLWEGHKREAVVLFVVLVLCAALIGVLKVGFINCGHLLPSLGIRSPSGHAAMSAAIYGTLASIVAHHFGGWRRVAARTLALYLVTLIGASRFLLEYHSVTEVTLGLAVGGALAWIASAIVHTAPQGGIRLRYLGFAMLVAGVLLFVVHVPAERYVEKIAEWARTHAHLCS